MEEKIVEEVVEETVIEPTKSPTTYRVERAKQQEHKRVLEDLGIADIAEGKSIIEEYRELSEKESSTTATIEELTKSKQALEEELAQIKEEKELDKHKSAIRERLVKENAIGVDIILSAIDFKSVTDDKYDSIVEALKETQKDMFPTTHVAGDPHVQSATTVGVKNEYTDAIKDKDYDKANALYLDKILKK